MPPAMRCVLPSLVASGGAAGATGAAAGGGGAGATGAAIGSASSAGTSSADAPGPAGTSVVPVHGFFPGADASMT